MIAIVGPTASGKSEVALQAARRTGAMLLSVDSMQVFRGMDIGTAKPSPDDRAEVPHAMIDVVEPEADFSVAAFQTMARAEIDAAEIPVVIVGGSGLHFRAVVDPLEFPPSSKDLRSELEAVSDVELVGELRQSDPGADAVVDLKNRRRVVRAVEILRLTGLTPTERHRSPAAAAVRDYRPTRPVIVFGLDRSTDLRLRISTRVEEMRAMGLMDEVRRLRGRLGVQASQAVGYKQLSAVVEGDLDEDRGFEEVLRATWALAKQQRTYFRRDPRIRWIDASDADAVSGLVDEIEREVRSWTS